MHPRARFARYVVPGRLGVGELVPTRVGEGGGGIENIAIPNSGRGGRGLLGAACFSPASSAPSLGVPPGREIFTAKLGTSPPHLVPLPPPRSGQGASKVPVVVVRGTFIYSAFFITTLLSGRGREEGRASSRQVFLIARSGQFKIK